MREPINDGGPAFPVAEDHKVAADLEWTCGMSLRDYFAGKALPAVFARYVYVAEAEGFDDDWRHGVASDSYEMADAMLAARKVPA